MQAGYRKSLRSHRLDVLVGVIEKMGFRQRWMRQIHSCIFMLGMEIHVNGTSMEFFQSCSGLQQGDPFSLYMFILIIEALSYLISKVVKGRRPANISFIVC